MIFLSSIRFAQGLRWRQADVIADDIAVSTTTHIQDGQNGEAEAGRRPVCWGHGQFVHTDEHPKASTVLMNTACEMAGLPKRTKSLQSERAASYYAT